MARASSSSWGVQKRDHKTIRIEIRIIQTNKTLLRNPNPTKEGLDSGEGGAPKYLESEKENPGKERKKNGKKRVRVEVFKVIRGVLDGLIRKLFPSVVSLSLPFLDWGCCLGILQGRHFL
jgi:hypothetical protein